MPTLNISNITILNFIMIIMNLNYKICLIDTLSYFIIFRGFFFNEKYKYYKDISWKHSKN